MNTKPEYIPGTCNIGPAEIKNRRIFAIYSAVLGIILITVLMLLHADKIWRLTLFIPAAAFGVGFLQWYNRFCVAFGLKGVFNFGDIGKTFTVDQKESFQKDLIKAWKMISTGIFIGIVAAILFYILP